MCLNQALCIFTNHSNAEHSFEFCLQVFPQAWPPLPQQLNWLQRKITQSTGAGDTRLFRRDGEPNIGPNSKYRTNTTGAAFFFNSFSKTILKYKTSRYTAILMLLGAN